jgi:DNA processing protein
MIQQLNLDQIPQISLMKKTPKHIFAIGDVDLLSKKKVSIVGTRKPTQYTIELTHQISAKLASNNIVVVSGAAMGVDAIAHKAAGCSNTIAVAGTGLDIRYPAINKTLIENIEQNGLMLSLFKNQTPPTRYTFPIRNELVVALGDILIVTQADLNSGTSRSIEYALKMNKPIYVLPHRLQESKATNLLLAKQQAKAIYDIDLFIQQITNKPQTKQTSNSFLEYCLDNPTYDEAMEKYPNQVFEYELSGKIEIKMGKVFVVSQY